MKLQSVLRQPVTAVAVSVVALTLAAGGGAVAAGLVTSQDIQDHTIKGVDIKSGAVGHGALHDGGVRSGTIRNRAVHTVDLNKEVLALIKKSGPQGPAGPAGPTGPQGPTGDSHTSFVTNLTGAFTATNPSVSMSPDGVTFGPYPDGGTAGGSVCYSGLSGRKFSSVKSLSYVERHYVNDPASYEGYAAPYLRVFLGDGTHDVVFSPNTQNTVFPEQDVNAGEFNLLVPTSGSARYDDDAENTVPDLTWQAVETAHADDVIAPRGICVSQGFSAGLNMSGLLRSLEVNGTTYNFGG